MNSDAGHELRSRVVQHLKGGQAFSPIEKVIEKVPFEQIGIAPVGLPYSFYQQFYHIRVSQYDILEYCRNKNYQALKWPDAYWPESPAPDNEAEWKDLMQQYFSEREDFCEMITDPANDLFEPFSANPDHNLLREAQLVIEHTSYHTGQLYILSRLLNENA